MAGKKKNQEPLEDPMGRLSDNPPHDEAQRRLVKSADEALAKTKEPPEDELPEHKNEPKDELPEHEEAPPDEPELDVPEGDQLDAAPENDIVGDATQGLPGGRTYAEMMQYPGRTGPIGEEQIAEAVVVLKKYKDGKSSLEQRVVENE